MACRALRLPALLLALALAEGAAALHADQKGAHDWSRAYVGSPLVYAQVTRSKALVVTASGTVAGLHLRSGDVRWRHAGDEVSSVAALAPAAGALVGRRCVAALSPGGRTIRGYAAGDGALLWEHATVDNAALVGQPGRGSAPSALLGLGNSDADGDGSADFAVLAGGVVSMRSAEDGTAAWTVDVAANTEGTGGPEVEVLALSFDEPNGRLYAAGTAAGAAIAVALDAGTGEVIGEGIAAGAGRGSTAVSDKAVLLVACEAGGPTLVALDATKTAVAIARAKDVASGNANMRFVPLADVAPGLTTPVKLEAVDGGISGVFALRGADASGVAVVRTAGGVDAPIELTLLRSWPVGAALDAALPKYVAAAVVSSIGTTVEVVDVDTGAVVQADEATSLASASHGCVFAARIATYARKDGTEGFRALIATEGATVALIQQGDVVWSRDEALAGVSDAVFVDLSREAAAGEVAPPSTSVPSWGASLEYQVLSFKVRMRYAKEGEHERLAELRRLRGDKLRATYDPVGFRKCIVVATSSGKVFGLHNGDGRVLWEAFLGGPPSLALLSWTVHHAHDAAPEVLVVGPGAAGGTRFAALDAHTGAVSGEWHLPFEVAQLVTLDTHEETTGRRVLLAVDKTGAIHVFPPTEAARHASRRSVTSVFIHAVDQDAGTLRGYRVVSASKGASSPFEAVQVWESPFPKGAERIVGLAHRPADEAVHSAVRILGDRSVLYKYLNPNVVFVATESDPGAHEPGLVAHLVDAVTGRLLYRVRHAFARGPVNAVLCENFVVYHYRNTRAHRNEVSVLELFDDTTGRTGVSVSAAVIDALMGRGADAGTVSSLAPAPLRVIGQSYYYSPGVKTVAVSQTHKGVTQRQVLFGTAMDQILTVDKKLLDPRRPAKLTQTDRDEGLLQYAEVLPIFPQSHLTTDTQIVGLRGIRTAPARLESQSLVFAFGLDIFYTRTMPSKTYDLLGDDFSYALLVITIGGLAAIAAAMVAMVHRLDLEKKWR